MLGQQVDGIQVVALWVESIVTSRARSCYNVLNSRLSNASRDHSILKFLDPGSHFLGAVTFR